MTTQSQCIAFIGLGNMGQPMAQNLLRAGHRVQVFDLVRANMSRLATMGAKACDSALHASQGATIVISMLPAGQHVEALYLGENGLAGELTKGTLVIDSSTIDAATSRQVAKTLTELGLAFIDAPVSGGVGGAKAGTLTFIVGGEDTDYSQALPILQAMGKHIFHAGAHGAGQVAKICNNMLLSVLMLGTSEALQMAIDNGLDPNVMSDIMLQSSGRNWALEVYNPCPDVMHNVPSSKGYQGGFAVDLMKKDLALAMLTGQGSQSSTPMGALAQSLFAQHSSQGNGHLDFSSIFTLFSKQESN
jgi:3-hydroxyisobutyrate dehydrogenase